MEHGVAGNAGIVDEHFDRSELGLNLFDAGRTGLKVGNVPLVDSDTSCSLEFLRRLIVAAVIGGDLVACGLKRLADGFADASCSARHQCDAGHDVLPVSSCPASCRASTSLLRPSLKTWMAGRKDVHVRLRRTMPGHDGINAMHPSRLPFHAHGDTHAAADTERGETLLRVALLHLVEQRYQYARTGGADRMPNGDGAAIDVDLLGVPAQVFIDRAGLRSERLVGLDEIEVADVPTGLLQRRARGWDRAGAHDLRIDAGLRPRHDASKRRLAEFGGFARLHQHHRAGTVVDARSVACGHGALFVESGAQLAYRVDRRAMLGILVAIDNDVAFA